jgi:hypothetical protein
LICRSAPGEGSTFGFQLTLPVVNYDRREDDERSDESSNGTTDLPSGNSSDSDHCSSLKTGSSTPDDQSSTSQDDGYRKTRTQTRCHNAEKMKHTQHRSNLKILIVDGQSNSHPFS